MLTQEIIMWIMAVTVLLGVIDRLFFINRSINIRMEQVRDEARARSEKNYEYMIAEFQNVRRETSLARHEAMNKVQTEIAAVDRRIDEISLTIVSKSDFHAHMSRLEAQGTVIQNAVTAINTRIDSVIAHFALSGTPK